jgi:hypothetical protein
MKYDTVRICAQDEAEENFYRALHTWPARCGLSARQSKR